MLNKNKNPGQRGKYAEGKVREVLHALSGEFAGFDWERIYDARSAGGKFPSRPGDFAFYAHRLHGLIEVKEVEHDFRLPSKNMKKEQIAKLYKRDLAGGLILVLVCHKTTMLWRSVPLSWLQQRAAQPSWDLSVHGTLASAEEALTPLRALLKMKLEGAS